MKNRKPPLSLVKEFVKDRRSITKQCSKLVDGFYELINNPMKFKIIYINVSYPPAGFEAGDIAILSSDEKPKAGDLIFVEKKNWSEFEFYRPPLRLVSANEKNTDNFEPKNLHGVVKYHFRRV